MANKIFRFEGVNQSDPSAANAGLSLINRAGGVVKFDIAAKVNGVTGLRFTSSVTGSYTIGRGVSNNSNNQHAFRGSFYIPTAPSADLRFGYIRNSVNDSQVVGFIVTPLGELNIYATGSLLIGKLANISFGTWYDLSLVMVGGSTTAGQVTAKLYSTATGAQVGSTLSSTTANLTTNTINGVELGIVSANANATVYWDDVQIDDGRTTEIGRLVPNTYIWNGTSWVSHTPYIWDGTMWVLHRPTILTETVLGGGLFGDGSFG